MARGCPTSPEVVEAIFATFAKNGSVTKTAKSVGLAKQTVSDILNSEPDRFGRIRTLFRVNIINEVWGPFEAAIDKLTELIPNCKDPIEAMSLVSELTKILSIASGMRAEDGAKMNAARQAQPISQYTTVITGEEIAKANKELHGGNGTNAAAGNPRISQVR